MAQAVMAANTGLIEQLQQRRLTIGISQRALADLVGLPQSHISKIESGKTDLRLSTFLEIAAVLDLEVTLGSAMTVADLSSKETDQGDALAVEPAKALLDKREEKAKEKRLKAYSREQDWLSVD